MKGQTSNVGELPPVERTSLARRVADLIRQAIVSGALPPAEPIPLREVAKRLGVSRTPVREALFHLSAVGLVDFVPGRVQIVSASKEAFEDSFVLREALEGMAARLAATNRTNEDLLRIEGHAQRSVAAVAAADADAFRAADIEFHRAVAQSAHSTQLIRYTLNAIDLALTFRNIHTLGRGLNATFAHMHLAIADAIARRDADAAESIAREHIRNVGRQVLGPPRRIPDDDIRMTSEGGNGARIHDARV